MGTPSESTQRELSIAYQHDRVKMVFKNLWVLVGIWMRVALALEGLILLMPLPPLPLKLINPFMLGDLLDECRLDLSYF